MLHYNATLIDLLLSLAFGFKVATKLFIIIRLKHALPPCMRRNDENSGLVFCVVNFYTIHQENKRHFLSL